MILGIGVDIVRIDRMRRAFERFGDRFAAKILHPEEAEVFAGTANKVAFLAKRFAAKEAASKALGTGMRQGVHFSQIKVSHDAHGAPRLSLEGKAQQIAAGLGVEQIFLSISDEQDNAIAFVLFEA